MEREPKLVQLTITAAVGHANKLSLKYAVVVDVLPLYVLVYASIRSYRYHTIKIEI